MTQETCTETYRVIHVPVYLKVDDIDIAEVDTLLREGAGGLYDLLKPYQVRTVQGMVYQAVNRYTNGCILADQTGLGKLVQSIVTAATLETYLHATGQQEEYSGVLFIFPSSIYKAQLEELHE
jgi:SNF2 family DNA or RNA helicase